MMAATTRQRAVTVWERFVTGDGLVVALAGLLVIAVALPLQDANWVPGMFPPVLTGLIAVAVTTLMIRSSIASWRIALTVLAIGAGLVTVVGAAMMQGFPEFVRVLNLYRELRDWASAISTEEVRAGVVEFGMFLTAMMWLLGYLGAWLALRLRQGWVAVVFGGVILSIALSNFGQSTAVWLAFFMVASVLLLIHMATSQRMVGWRERRLQFEPSTVLSQSGILLVASAAIILIVSVVPTPSAAPLGAVAEAFEDRARRAGEEFARLFNGLPSRRHVTTLIFGQTTEFRGNPNLTDDLVFTVGGEEPNYWRARTYTNYTSTGWETEEATFGAFEPHPEGDLERVPSSHDFAVIAATDTLFHPGLPSEFDRPIDALSFGDIPGDTLQVRIGEGLEFFPTRTNLRYQSTGLKSNATAAQLRLATNTEDIPQAVIDRYTQLPETLPRRVSVLAETLTRGIDNQFDAIEELRRYVRAYPYTLDISAPPPGEDGVDYFLFGIRRGYCDYYASSLAVMLRTLGIPSRYVLGHASGRWDEETQRWQVLQLNYHSWIEAYFPDYGWVIFEATPSNAIEFGGGVNRAAPPTVPELEGIELGEILEDEEEDTAFTPVFDDGGNPYAIVGLVFWVLAGAAVVVLVITYYRWWFRLGRLSRADEFYAKMQRLGTLLGVPARRSQTPAEYAELLAGEMPELTDDFRAVAEVYSLRRYSAGTLPMSDLRRAEERWPTIRKAMLRRLFSVRPA